MIILRAKFFKLLFSKTKDFFSHSKVGFQRSDVVSIEKQVGKSAVFSVNSLFRSVCGIYRIVLTLKKSCKRP